MNFGSIVDRIGGLLGFESETAKKKRLFMEKSQELTLAVNALDLELVSFKMDELDLLSMKSEVIQKGNRRNPKITKFPNIYHEPIFVSVLDYLSRGDGEMAMKVFSRSNVYTYWIKSDSVLIWSGNNFWGHLMPNGEFVYKNNKVVGRISSNKTHGHLEFAVSEKVQATMDLMVKDIKASTRAFDYTLFSSESAFELTKILALFILSNPSASFKLNL